jgi:hypothetical protein
VAELPEGLNQDIDQLGVAVSGAISNSVDLLESLVNKLEGLEQSLEKLAVVTHADQRVLTQFGVVIALKECVIRARDTFVDVREGMYGPISKS